MNDNTTIFNTKEIMDKNVQITLKEIVSDLKERGYNPIKQITGYLISGDPGYISSYKDCRKRIMCLDRNDIVELILESYLK